MTKNLQGADAVEWSKFCNIVHQLPLTEVEGVFSRFKAWMKELESITGSTEILPALKDESLGLVLNQIRDYVNPLVTAHQETPQDLAGKPATLPRHT